ncbi:hypothetical protein ABPG72_013304 [Tetrahymena utriculariae]
MAFYIDLYMSCPCHSDYIPEKCQIPVYWYHNCKTNKLSKKLQQVNQNLYLYCGVCSTFDHIKNFEYECQDRCSNFMPYKNNSPQASIILSQQLANPKLSKEQRALFNALLLNLLDES